MDTAADRHENLIHWLTCAGLMVAVAIAYGGALHGPLIFDDYNSILFNDHVQSVWPLTKSMTTPAFSVLAGRWIVSFSFALNYAAGKYEPYGYHLVNVGIHMACTLLLYGLIRRTLLLPRMAERVRPSGTTFAGAAALLWAVHPLQTESVTYVTQRTESMEAMFLLATFYCIVRAAQGSGWWRVAAVLACAAGMGCKEQMVVTPVLAMLYDWMFLPRERSRRRGNYVMYLALFCTLVILVLELHSDDLDSKSGYGLKYVNKWDYLKTQAGVIVHYLRLTFWPKGQEIDYFDWPIVTKLGPAIAPGLLLSGLLIASVISCCKRQWQGFLGVCFFALLGPTSSIVPNFTEIAAERRMYLPLAPVIIVVLAVLWGATRAMWARGALVMVVAAVLCGLTIARNQLYRIPIVLWRDAVAQRPNNPRAHTYLGLAYTEEKDWKDAIAQDNMAIRLSPHFKAAQDLQVYLVRKLHLRTVTRPSRPVSPADSAGD